MHYSLLMGSLRVAITEGVLRAVGIGRRNNFYAVALRYRVAYSLEHHNGFWASFDADQLHLEPEPIDRRRGALSAGIIP